MKKTMKVRQSAVRIMIPSRRKMNRPMLCPLV